MPAPDDHPCKRTLRNLIDTPPPTRKRGCGLRRISDLVQDMIPASRHIEADTPHELPWMHTHEITETSEETEATQHKEWLLRTEPTRIRLETDGSKITDRTTGNGWHCV